MAVDPSETEVDVGSSPAGPCASEVCIRPKQSVQFDEEILAADSEEVAYPEEFLEHMRKHKVTRDGEAWELLWREWQEEAMRDPSRDASGGSQQTVTGTIVQLHGVSFFV